MKTPEHASTGYAELLVKLTAQQQLHAFFSGDCQASEDQITCFSCDGMGGGEAV